MDEQAEAKALIQLNILNNGFTNHGTENAEIDMRNDEIGYKYAISSELALGGDDAVIPPNPNGELSLTEYLDSVAEGYDDMANETIADFEQYKSKLEKVRVASKTKNPVKSLLARRKYHKLKTQYRARLKELETVNLYRSAADSLQHRLAMDQ